MAFACLSSLAFAIRKKLKVPYFLYPLAVFSVLAIGFTAYGIVESKTLATNRYSIDLRDYEGAEFDVVLISDLHLGRFGNDWILDDVVRKANEEDAKMVFILGDVVNSSSKHLDDLDAFKELKDKTVYFVYGNHDYYYNDNAELEIVPDLTEKLEELEFNILNDEWHTLTPDGETPIYISGIEDLWSQNYDLEFLETIDTESTNILLSHNPDAVIKLEDAEYSENVDLVVSGHTHGGEMRIPGIGPLSPLPTELPDSYDKGYFEYEDLPLYITSGVGNVGVRLRTFNQPEIVVLTIK